MWEITCAKINQKPNFNAHIIVICKKVGLKLSGFSRLTPYIAIPQRRLLLNVLYMSQFSYCLLLWMCHRCSKNPKINPLNEFYLRLIYYDKNLWKVVGWRWYVTIHKQNLYFLAIELFKAAKNSAPTIFYEMFHKNEQNI